MQTCTHIDPGPSYNLGVGSQITEQKCLFLVTGRWSFPYHYHKIQKLYNYHTCLSSHIFSQQRQGTLWDWVGI